MPQLDERAGFARAGLNRLPEAEDAPELYRPAPPADDPLARADRRRDEGFITWVAGQATELFERLFDTARQNDPPEQVEGFTARVNEAFDIESQDLLENAPNPAAREAGQAAIDRARARGLEGVMAYEAAGRGRQQRRVLEDALNSFRTAAERSPKDADALHAEGEGAIAAAVDWLGTDGVNKLTGRWREDIYGAAVRSLVRDDPEEATRRLAGGVYDNVLGPETRESLQAEAQQRAQALALDRAQAEATSFHDATLQREWRRMEFHAQFHKARRNGQANHQMLDDALRDNVISSVDHAHLKRGLVELDAQRRAEFDRASRVSAFLDGFRDMKPTNTEIRAHYKLVMNDILNRTPSELRGQVFFDYLIGLKNEFAMEHEVSIKSGNVNVSLPPPTDAPVHPEEIYGIVNYKPEGANELEQSLRNIVDVPAAILLARQSFADIEKWFKGLPAHNTALDAVRHVYWNILMARDFGPEIAKKIADAHEVKGAREMLYGILPELPWKPRQSQPESERLMDLYNNAVGRELWNIPENQGRDPLVVVFQALIEGKIQTKPMTIEANGKTQ